MWRTKSSGRRRVPGIHDPVIANDDGILERGATAQSGRAKLFDLSKETKGAGVGNLGSVRCWIDGEVQALATDRRGVEDSLDGHFEAGSRHESGALAWGGYLHRLENFEVAARRVQIADADPVNRRDEVRSGSVANRSFGSVDLGDDVVDAQPGQS